MRARAGWWVSIVCGLLGSALGQEPACAPGPVRVSLRGGGVIEGRLEREDREGFELRISGVGRMHVPRRRVVRLERLSSGASLLQAARAAVSRGRVEEAQLLLHRALQDPDLEVRGRARAQLDDLRDRRPEDPPPARASARAEPEVRPPGDDERGELLAALATPLEPSPGWLRGVLQSAPVPPGLPFQGQVFALDLDRGQPLGVLLLVRGPSAPPGLDLFDAQGKRVIARHVGQGERSAELVITAGKTGRYYLFVGCPLPGADDRLPFRLLVTGAIDPSSWDTSRWLRPGQCAEGAFDPATPELDGAPARFYSLRLRPDEQARFSSTARVRLFTGSGIPLPDGRAVYDGHYLAAVICGGPLERGRVPFRVQLETVPE